MSVTFVMRNSLKNQRLNEVTERRALRALMHVHACGCGRAQARMRVHYYYYLSLLLTTTRAGKALKIKGLRGNKTPLPACYRRYCGILRVFARHAAEHCEHPDMRLPESAQEFARIIGVDLTLRLATLATQRRIYIPVRPLPDNHPIVRTIGREPADRIQHEFSGSVMPLATCRTQRRSKAIAIGFVTGWKRADLAARHHVAERTVLRALDRVTTNDLADPPPPMGPSCRGSMRVARDTSSKA